MATETRYEVIPAGYTPEDWAAFGPGIMARLRAELALAEFAKPRSEDAFGDLGRAAAKAEAEIDALTDALTKRATTGDSFVHTYKGEGLTACGLEVVGPCPDCATANGERT